MKVLVLAGGDSQEKDVSSASGEAVWRAIRRLDGYEPILIDPAVQAWQSVDCDIVFPLLHGTGGEDGTVQQIFEATRRPFVGSSSAASRLTFDKAACSKFLSELNVACPIQCVLRTDDSEADWEKAILQFVQQSPNGNRWVVKPNQQGSSVGISVVEFEAGTSSRTLISAVAKALTFDDTCLLQPYVDGRELTVPLVDGHPLPVVEVFAASGVYDYDAKYKSAETRYAITADKTAQQATEIAQHVNQLCQTDGIVRIDFRVDKEGHPWFLELNTIPGMTDRSLVPMSAQHMGWSLPELCRHALANA